MTLNTARKIEAIMVWVGYIILMPFVIASIILIIIKKPFDWIIEWRSWVAVKIGNKLMHMSDAVKDGTIKNPYCLRNYTARMAWQHLKRAEESGKEAEI
jgi:hypothetical protein